MNFIAKSGTPAKLLLSFILAGSAGCDPRPVATLPGKPLTKSPAVKPVSPIADTPPDVILSPEEYSREVRASRTAVKAKYQGKVIQITGILNKYLKDFNKVTLCLGVSDHILDIECLTTDQEPWLLAVPGQTITIKGRLPEELIIPKLQDCVILSSTGENHCTLTIQQLAKNFASEPNKAKDMYEDQCLILSGVVLSKADDPGEYGDTHVSFETGSQVKCVADFSKFEGEAKYLKPGKPAHIIGRLSIDKDTGNFQVWACFYIGPRE